MFGNKFINMRRLQITDIALGTFFPRESYSVKGKQERNKHSTRYAFTSP